MAKVYLETSFFSACVSSRTDPASIVRREQGQTWWTMERNKHELFISAEVLKELSNPAFSMRDLALSMTADLRLIPITDEVRGFARLLVSAKVMPGPEEAGDALHVAAATVHRLDYLLTFNQKHLANVDKMKHLQAVSVRAGYLLPLLVTPEQFGEDRFGES